MKNDKTIGIIETHGHPYQRHILELNSRLVLPPVVQSRGNKTFNPFVLFETKYNISDFLIEEAKENRRTLQKIKAKIKIPKVQESSILVRDIDENLSILYRKNLPISEHQIKEFIESLPQEIK